MKRLHFYRQLDTMDCGPTCLRMVARQYGKRFSLQELRDRCHIDRQGVSLRGISEAAESIGFRSMAVKVPFKAVAKDGPSLQLAPLPLIAHWNQKHFIVVYRLNKHYVWIADPAIGKIKLTHQAFKSSWETTGQRGIALLLEPGAQFYQNKENDQMENHWSFGQILHYLRPHKRLLINLGLCLMLIASFQLAFPFFTQAVVDVGIQNKDLNFVYLVLFGQLMLFFGQTVVGFIQNWIFLHISTRIGISLIADFLYKLMRLPLGFFDSKFIGDLLQRIGDQRRIESFLIQSSFQGIMAIVVLILFGAVLMHYSLPIFLLFVFGAMLYFGWIFLFLKKRKEIDYQIFQKMANNQHTLIEIIRGMTEIKLQGSQRKQRSAWASIQAKLFRVQMKALAIGQWQEGGAQVINQLKDIFITFLSAQAVISGKMTLGMMLAVQYMVGRLNAPLQQLVGFIKAGQDAAISMERLNEVQNHPEEEPLESSKLTSIPLGDIHIKNVSFRYTPIADAVLKNINLVIPRGKVTAIVGTSGSGKTTLFKLLLGFYPPTEGNIFIGQQPLANLSMKKWRAACGVVLQDGFIFSNTIQNNVAESSDQTDQDQLYHALQTANIYDHIQTLPLGIHTMLGEKGNGISQGQRQRMLIARAVYKNPDFLLLDEATNALDAKNERVILQNLNAFFKNRTVVVIAHRLSTVSRADQIVVLDQGRIIEVGNHKELTIKRGAYYALVKNQLELGN